MISGTKFQKEDDYSSGLANGLQFSRYYKSSGYVRMSGLSVLPGSLEKMQGSDFWHHTYDRRLFIVSGNAEVMAFEQMADGNLRAFDTSGHEMANTNGAAARLQTSGGGYDVILANSDVEHYNAAGLLTSITTRAGLVTTLTYSGGLLSTVVDSFGHLLAFSYNPDQSLASVMLPDNSVISYTYDGFSRLTAVSYPDSTTRQYQYGNAVNQWLLTGIVDANGLQFATYNYNDDGKVISENHAGVENYQFMYGASSTTMTDPLGTSTQFNYLAAAGVNHFGSYSNACATCGQLYNAIYDSDGNPSIHTDFNGNQTSYVYDSVRNLETSRTEGYGTNNARTIATQWHSTYRLPTSISVYNGGTASGTPLATTAYTYDSAGNQLTRTITEAATSASRTWTYTYDSYGRVLTADGPRSDVSDVTTYTYYSCNTGYQCGQVETITDPLGHITTYNTYNAHGQPLTMTDPNGVVTTLTYDSRQRLTSQTIGTEATAFEYWPTGLLKKVTLPDSSFLSYVYDNAHRLTSMSDSLGNSIHYTLDAAGNRTQEDSYDPSNALTQTRSRVFDTLGRVYQELGAAGQVVSYEYDNNGNLLTLTDARNRSSFYTHDALNRLSTATDPAYGFTQYGYDARDNVTTVTDPRSLVTQYAYSGLNDLTGLVSPDTGTTIYSHDVAGNLQQSEDARTRSGTYSYDAANRVEQITYSDQTLYFDYDQGTNGKGRLTTVTDGSGETQWNYEVHGRPVTKQQTVDSRSFTVSYGYNTAGQLSTITTPSGQTVSYTYANNRVAGITVNSTTVLSQTLYAPFGPTRGWQWGNGTYTVREYDNDGRLTTLDSAGLYTYGYYADGTIASVNEDTPAIVSLPSGLSTFSVSGTSNQLTAQSGTQTRSYSYDAAGNMLSDGTRTFTYNDAGRMLTSNNGTVTTTYAYNALGQRVKKSNSSGTTYFVYDEVGHLVGEYDGGGDLVEEIVWLDDIPVASIRVDQNGTGVGVFYIHTDHLNTPRKITRPTDNVIVWRFDSDPFGNGTANEDADGNGAVLTFNLRFPGQYYDSETGLNYNYFRDYDPATGRYVESDPIGLEGGLNTYTYAENNPLALTDAFGLNSDRTRDRGDRTRPQYPRNRECNSIERGRCSEMCKLAGKKVRSCKVKQIWTIRRVNSSNPDVPLTVWGWKDQSMSCDCTDDEDVCKQ